MAYLFDDYRNVWDQIEAEADDPDRIELLDRAVAICNGDGDPPVQELMSDPIFRKRYLQQQTRTVREAIKGLTDSEANLVLYDAQNASLEPDGKGMMTENEENFACEMAALANKQMEEMRGMTEEQTALHVKRTIDAAQIGWGVYQDDSERGGIGLHVIKGIRIMQAVVAWGEEAAFVTDAIPCIGLDQAIAAAETWGDGSEKLQ